MLGKKKLLARVGAYTGVTRLVEALPGPPSLLILNYHRVGDAEKTPYDSGTFSCTTAEFDWQVDYLKRRFPIVDLEGAVDIAHGRVKTPRTSLLLTFDDGYRDNFDQAFPVLRAHGVSATFFLPTAFVGTGRLPWWDLIAFIVKSSAERRIALSYPEAAEFDLGPSDRSRTVAAILQLFKRPAVADTERFIRELEAACGAERPAGGAERCFLNWDEAREMQESGMRFGSHTHTHEILSKHPYARQLEELNASRRLLESELGRSIDTLAYPVGQPDTFNDETFKALREARYSTAFSFYSGVNVPGRIQPFNVLRGGVDGEDRSVLRLRVALRAATRQELF
ncbi:MAG: polysaccharide deacetylase family protein [Elusimicrobiota bacterium]